MFFKKRNEIIGLKFDLKYEREWIKKLEDLLGDKCPPKPPQGRLYVDEKRIR